MRCRPPTTIAKQQSTRVRSGATATIKAGRRVLNIEVRALQAMTQRLDKSFSSAVDVLYRCKGKVVVSGMGKSGLIGQKIAATMASTGTPSFFLHPAEGLHGDLGMLARGDVLVAISNSGETREILLLLPFMKRVGIPVVAIVGELNSTLAKNSAVALDVSVKEEACPLGLAPTASTTVTLAIGDALSVALLEKRGFKEQDFVKFHPGGSLGRRLLVKVRDVMHSGTKLPQVVETASALSALLEMSAKQLGMTTVVNRAGALIGIITDGDLRRCIQQGGIFFHRTAGSLASRRPKLIRPDELAAKAVALMERHSITTLIVAENSRQVLGVVHLHDLLKHGIV